MTYTIFIRLATIALVTIAIIMLSRDGKLGMKAPMLAWLIHVMIFNIVLAILYPTGNVPHADIALLNGWSAGIRIQAILTVILGIAYLRRIGHDALKVISDVVCTHSAPGEDQGEDWLDRTMATVLDSMPLLHDSGSNLDGD